MQPKKIFLKDDGVIPNSTLPLLLYRNAFEERGSNGAAWLEHTFHKNNWSNSWRNGVYSYHHYHSNSHEVLGVYAGRARLQVGGKHGEKIEVKAGHIIMIPAGVAHKNLDSTNNFGVVGAYPNGSSYDINTGKEGERPRTDKNIAAVPLPDADPLLGKDGAAMKIWAANS